MKKKSQNFLNIIWKSLEEGSFSSSTATSLLLLKLYFEIQNEEWANGYHPIMYSVTDMREPITRSNQFSRDKISALMGQSNNQDWILCEEIAFLACAKKEDRNYDL